MKLPLFLFVAATCLVFAALLSFRQMPQSAKLDFDSPKSQTKNGQTGSPVVFTFNFQNAGNEALTLKVADVSSNSAKVSCPARPFKAGESGAISVTYQSGTAGGFTASIVIATNEPGGQNKHTLGLSGQLSGSAQVPVKPKDIDGAQPPKKTPKGKNR